MHSDYSIDDVLIFILIIKSAIYIYNFLDIDNLLTANWFSDYNKYIEHNRKFVSFK